MSYQRSNFVLFAASLLISCLGVKDRRLTKCAPAVEFNLVTMTPQVAT
jgi:hypothetical protein